MPPGAGRFGQQGFPTAYPHPQQPRLQTHNPQTQQSSSGLPPPSYASHQSFTQGNGNSGINPFAVNQVNGFANGFSSAAGLGGGGSGLASEAAIAGFTRGAQIQQQQAEDQLRKGRTGSTVGPKKPADGRIRDVWRGNLRQEMAIIRDLIADYPYISMVRGLQGENVDMADLVGPGHGVSWYHRATNGRVHQ